MKLALRAAGALSGWYSWPRRGHLVPEGQVWGPEGSKTNLTGQKDRCGLTREPGAASFFTNQLITSSDGASANCGMAWQMRDVAIHSLMWHALLDVAVHQGMADEGKGKGVQRAGVTAGLPSHPRAGHLLCYHSLLSWLPPHFE